MGGDIENIVWPLKYMNFLDISVTLVAQMVKNLPAVLETWVLSLGQEDPLEKGMATRSGILVWKMPWTDKPGGLQFIGLQSDTTEQLTHTHTSTETSVLPWQIQDKCLLFFLISATCRAVNTGNRFKKKFTSV